MLLRSSLTSTIKAANIYNELLENPPENDSFCMCANDFIPSLTLFYMGSYIELFRWGLALAPYPSKIWDPSVHFGRLQIDVSGGYGNCDIPHLK